MAVTSASSRRLGSDAAVFLDTNGPSSSRSVLDTVTHYNYYSDDLHSARYSSMLCIFFFFFFFSRMIIRERSRATTGGSRKGSTVWNKSVAAGDAPSWADPLLRLHPSTNTGCIEGRLTSARPATGSVPCVLVYISRNGTHERDILSAEYYRYWYSSHCTGCQREARYCILHRDRTGASFMNSTDARRTPRKRSHY